MTSLANCLEDKLIKIDSLNLVFLINVACAHIFLKLLFLSTEIAEHIDVVVFLNILINLP